MGQKFQKFGSRTVINAGDEPQLTMEAFGDWPETPDEAAKAPYIRVFYLPDDGRRRYLPKEIEPLLACCRAKGDGSWSASGIRSQIPQILHGDKQCPFRIWRVQFSDLGQIILDCYNIQTLEKIQVTIQSPPTGRPWLKCVFQLTAPKNGATIEQSDRRYCCLRRSRKGNPLMRMILWKKGVGAADSSLSFREYRYLGAGSTQWCNYRLPFFSGWRKHLSIEIKDLPRWEKIAAAAEEGA